MPSSPSPRPAKGARPPRRPPGTAPAGTPTVGGRTGPSAAVVRRRRLAVLIGVLLVVVIALGGWWAVSRTRSSGPGAASTVLIPSPTPTITAATRAATTPFAQALPSTVLQFALTGSQADPDWVAKGAIEAYTEAFSDGGSAKLTVRAGQWETAAEADAVLTALTGTAATAAGTATATSELASGQVTVGGQAVGSYVIRDAGDGTATATWTNSTALLQVTGPVAEVPRVFSAYRL